MVTLESFPTDALLLWHIMFTVAVCLQFAFHRYYNDKIFKIFFIHLLSRFLYRSKIATEHIGCFKDEEDLPDRKLILHHV